MLSWYTRVLAFYTFPFSFFITTHSQSPCCQTLILKVCVCVCVWLSSSLKEAQATLMRKALVKAVGGNKIVNILLKHMEAERTRLQSCNCTEEKTSTKAFYTQHGQYKLIYTPGQCALFKTYQHHKSSTNTNQHTAPWNIYQPYSLKPT